MSQPDLPRSWKIATLWLLIGLGLFLAIRGWEAYQAQTRFSVKAGVIEIQRAADGHFHWPGTVLGERVDFLIDTGATGTVLPAKLVDKLMGTRELPRLGSVHAQTANGPAVADVVAIDLVLEGGVAVENLRVAILPQLQGPPLLGMDVLGRLAWQQDGGVLRIRPSGR